MRWVLVGYRLSAGVFGFGAAMNPETRAVLVGLIAITLTFAVVMSLYYTR
jgi:hypothetical protein